MTVDVAFVLVEPGEPGNIGAAARALQTMGFSDLRLVRPQADHTSGIAQAMAHGSAHLLEAAQVYETLEDAIADCDLACATTARHRLEKYHYLSVVDLPQAILDKGPVLSRIAIVFGSERSGLSNQDLRLCDLMTTIPQAVMQPSLNLSQAVMLYSFTLAHSSVLQPETTVQITDQRMNTDTMPPAQYQHLKQAIGQTMERVGLHQRTQRYVLGAIARLGYEDLALLQTIRTFVDNKLNQLSAGRSSDS